MMWMETCATMAAVRFSRCRALLVAVDSLHFFKPTRVGDAVIGYFFFFFHEGISCVTPPK